MYLLSFSILTAARKVLVGSDHPYCADLVGLSRIRLLRKVQAFLVHALILISMLWLVSGVFINGKEKLLKYSLPVLRVRKDLMVNVLWIEK